MIILIIILTALVNLIGVLGPELSFDALWYHLTLPKIYLLDKSIHFIPDGLLYYSALPRLGELFYTLALLIADERLTKFIHFSFGLLACYFTYLIAQEFLNKKDSLMASLIFYSTLIVGWLSTTSYIDLQRTAFEAGGLLFFLKWWKKEKLRDLLISSLLMGLAISTKLLALGSILIFIFLIIFKRKKNFFLHATCYLLLATVSVLPWFIFAYKNTGNPFYPIGSNILDESHRIPSFSIIRFISDFWNLILKPQDPISPIFLIILPLGVIEFIREIRRKKVSPLFIYGIFSYIIWYFTPRTGGGRFILPYLPGWSVLASLIINNSPKVTKIFLINLILLISLIHLGYRLMANKKYLPFILRKQTKTQFLCSNLDFSTNVFYDCDEYFKKKIKTTETILIYGSHNLYYVNFPFIHESWLNKSDKFNYVLSQNCQLPKKFKKMPLIYQNQKTGIKLYKVISN